MFTNAAIAQNCSICKYNVESNACVTIASMVFLIGDSYTNDSNEFPAYLLTSADIYSFGGRTLDNMAANFSLEISNVASVEAVIVHGGLNDIFFNISALEILQDFKSIVDISRSLGHPIWVSNIPPNSGLTVSQQAQVNRYNDMLDLFVRSQPDIKMIDVNSLLDTNNDNAIDAIYDSGDATHPNVAGSQKIADAYNAAMICAQ